MSKRAVRVEGEWVWNVMGQAVMLVSVRRSPLASDKLTVSVRRRVNFRVDEDGDLIEVSGIEKEIIFSDAGQKDGVFSFRESGISDGEFIQIRVTGQDRCTISWPGEPLQNKPLTRLSANEHLDLVPELVDKREYADRAKRAQRSIAVMLKEDQRVRQPGSSVSERERVDDGNTSEVLAIHREFGWPAATKVGKTASTGFWILVQHQPLSVQKLLLPALEDAVGRGEVSQIRLAYLYDRIQVESGNLQRWGTQTTCRDGVAELLPVEAAEQLNARRSEIGLPLIEEYLEVLKQQCASEAGQPAQQK